MTGRGIYRKRDRFSNGLQKINTGFIPGTLDGKEETEVIMSNS